MRLVVVQLSWLSDRALAAQARGVPGSTPGNCRPFHFALFRQITSKFLYYQHKARCCEQLDTFLVLCLQNVTQEFLLVKARKLLLSRKMTIKGQICQVLIIVQFGAMHL